MQGLQEWIGGGHYIEHRGHKIFVYTAGTAPKGDDVPIGADPDVDGVFIIHGFPGSSWDWSGIVPEVAKHTRVVVFDLWGHGQSDKPTDGKFEDYYSLYVQADLAEAVAKAEGLHNVILVTHDMGQTVGAELMARQDAGKLDLKLHHVIIHNGSTLVDLVQLNVLQKKFLALPDELLPEDMDREEFREGLRVTFGHAASEETLNAMLDQVFAKQGSRLMPRICRYLIERKENLQHWQDALCNFSSAPFSVYWGLKDPVSVEPMADKIKKLRPSTDLHKWPDVGHWPSIEVPERIAKAILDRLNG